MPTFVGILKLTSIKNTLSKILKQNMSLYIQQKKIMIISVKMSTFVGIC